jgi:hypothetical protein
MRVRTTNYHRANKDTLRPRNNAVIARRRKLNPIKAWLSSIRNRARIAGLECTITEEDLAIPTHCPVLGMRLSFGLGRASTQTMAERDARYSLDRIDNNKGYVPGNAIVVSYRANRMKSDATVAEMQALARFYARLASNEIGQADLPSMQPHQEKQTGPVPVSDKNGHGLGVVLPQSGLRLQGGI